MERRASSSGSLRSSGRSSQRFSEVVSQGPTAIPAREDVDAAISSALAAEGLSLRRQTEGHHRTVQQHLAPSSLPRGIDNAGNGTSPTRPPTVPATIPNTGPPPAMVSSLATGAATGAQTGGNLHPGSAAIGDGAGGIGGSHSGNSGGGGGGLLDWALWPLWGTIDALKWAGGTVNQVAVAPVIRLASPWGLAGSLLTTVKAYTPQRARDLARIAGNFGLNAAGLVGTPAGGQVLRSTGRATSSLSMAVSSPAGRQFLVDSATGLVKLAEAMDTPEAKNFIQQGAVVAARGMDALASRHTKIFVKDLADVVIRLVELANSREATKLAAEFTVNVAHALEMEHTAGIERKRAAAKTASPDSADGEIGSITGEAFAASVDVDGGAHDLGRRAGASVDDEAVVSGGTRVDDGLERGPEDAGEGEEQTLDDLVREARLERARQEGCRGGGGGGGICVGEGPGRAEHNRGGTAENSRAFDDGNGDRPSDVDVDADADGNGAGSEGSTTDGPDTDGVSRSSETARDAPSTPSRGPSSSAAGETAVAISAAASLQGSPSRGLSPQGRGSTGTGGSRSDTAADGPVGDANNASDRASDAFAADTAAAATATATARSRLGTGGRGAESDGAESVGSGAHPAVEYERDGKARLPRFRSSDFASVLKGQPLGLEMQLEPPNEDSLDYTVARASRLAPEGALCARSPRAGTAGGGPAGVQEAGPGTAGGALFSWRGQEARDSHAVRARAAGGWKQALFAWVLLLLAGDGLRQRWKGTSRGGESPARPSSPTLTSAQSEEDSGSGFAVGGSGGGSVGQKYVFGAAFLPPTCQDPASGATMAIWVTPSGPCLSPASISRGEVGEGAGGQFGEGDGGGGPACAASFRLCSAAEVTVRDVGRDASPGAGEL